MARSITVVLLDREPSSTDHYVELLREELIKRLKPTKLWVASVEAVEVQDQKESPSVKLPLVKV